MKIVTIIAFILVLLGAVNWMLIGLFNFNIISTITMNTNLASRITYSIVGLAGLWMIFYSFVYKPFSEAK